MNRQEFIARLEQALHGMPVEERRRAVEYYENYFDEAGEENLETVLQELGAPEKVAADILKDFNDGFATKFEQKQHIKDKFQSLDNGQKLLMILLAAIAVVCIVPAVVGVVGGVGGVVLGLLAAVLAVFCCIPVLAITAWCCAVACGIGAVAVLFAAQESIVALLLLGIALICSAIGILLVKVTVYLFRSVFPLCINKFVEWMRCVLHKNGKE